MPKSIPQTEEARQAEAQMRKKKNAEAQANFRRRRATYISTLEETVTNLESVVIQLQETSRDARVEVQQLKELRQQNANLRHEFREREKFWRGLWQSRKTTEGDELPAGLNNNLHSYTPEGIAYRSADDPSICNGQYTPAPPHGYHSPYPTNETSSPTQRAAKFNPYSYSISHRDHSWTTGGDSATTHSGSPTLASPSDLSLPFSAARYGEESKPVLDGAQYGFPASRSISPTSTAVASAPTPFQFTTDFDFHRQSSTSEISLSGPGSDAVRYRLGNRRPDSILPPLMESERERESSRLTLPADSVASRTASPKLSATVAMLKAQTSGGSRRTRTRNRKLPDARKIAEVESLSDVETRPSKRQRTGTEED
ncbi:BZIP domain-containing protein [Mycena indigotica]|uniref:BZIP domain-containing protein n=1 Tax=Mycena indigotica TaxID=2126181 RepID=A0A8H6SZX9_9AGAR|nr:BZIP domain-containing protein [Mycena indigotica]KAF7306940.1 BZIP domain-containing protein [Mycena indigotica]